MRVALVGNQNSGKTSLFNHMTGLNQKIGNWPGVTLEKKEGIIRTTKHELIDLPGIYSINSLSIEEGVTKHYLLNEKIDLIVNVIDCTQIERSLYLTTQLLELGIPMVIALNMHDLSVHKQIRIDITKMSNLLDTSIIFVSAVKKTGIFDLIKIINCMDIRKNHYQDFYDSDISAMRNRLVKLTNSNSPMLHAVKYIENDENFMLNEFSLMEKEVQLLRLGYDSKMDEVIASERYKWIESIRDQCVSSLEHPRKITDYLDRIFLNKYAAIPIFILVMLFIYYLSVGVVGSITVEWIDTLVTTFGEFVSVQLTNIGASPWSVSLVVDGVIAGVGAILNFIPQMIILFTLIAILEATGYMSRIAFVLDRIFQKVGLSGKSLIPFIIGSGCSVPAIMATRTIHNEEERKMTIMLTPFIPCSAKLPIMTLFIGYFFNQSSGMISASLYFLSIAVILISAVIMRKLVYKGKYSSFISELPEYKMPDINYVFMDVWHKATAFIKRAGSVIFLASLVVWFLISFSWQFEYGIDINNSMLASIGNALSWIFYPMLGELNWGASVSAIQGLVAKEQVVSSMAIIAGFSSETSEGALVFGNGIFASLTAASAYAFVVFNLFSAPCFGAIGAMRKELGSKRRMLKAVVFQTGTAWILATLIFQIWHLMEGLL